MTNRRNMIKTLAVGTAMVGSMSAWSTSKKEMGMMTKLKGNIQHSVCRWTYSKLSLEQLCKQVKELGFAAIDLVGPKDWKTLKAHGIDSSMCNGAEINLIDGWNNPAFHSTLIKNYTEHIEYVAKAGYKNLICFSGNSRGMDDETGLKNCAEGLKQILSIAEKNKVTLVMELLNSRVDHPDYMCHTSAWGVELCKRLGSENFKLLYDIYHMQVDEGNVIATIRKNHAYFGHYHTAGVPGRNELSEQQELNYPAIMKAIVASGFKGYVAHEFVPTGKTDEARKEGLKQAVAVCDV